MRDAPASIRLPPGAHELPLSGTEGASQTWKVNDGTVSYRIGETSTQPADTATQTVSRTECVDTIGGIPARVVMYYQNNAYVPGQVILAYWPLQRRKELRFIGIARDSLEKGQLLRILSSVQFSVRE